MTKRSHPKPGSAPIRWNAHGATVSTVVKSPVHSAIADIKTTHYRNTFTQSTRRHLALVGLPTPACLLVKRSIAMYAKSFYCLQLTG